MMLVWILYEIGDLYELCTYLLCSLYEYCMGFGFFANFARIFYIFTRGPPCTLPPKLGELP